MKIRVIVVLVVVLIICFFIVADRWFYAVFVRHAKRIRAEAGKQDDAPISEDDLKRLPEPVARYLRFTGLVGRKKMGTLHLFHSGTFRPGAERSFMPIRGEYYLTTKKPSFSWYGKVSMLPGLTFAAFDSYTGGRGRMLVKVMSVFNVVNARSPETGLSAFGRCVAEMTLVPSFFLDSSRVTWTRFDSGSADCVVTDSGLSTQARLYFHADGALDKIVVDRFYDRGKGQATLEKFTGVGHDVRDYNGLKLASVIDGYWNLKEGDLHYVHFVVDRVEFE